LLEHLSKISKAELVWAEDTIAGAQEVHNEKRKSSPQDQRHIVSDNSRPKIFLKRFLALEQQAASVELNFGIMCQVVQN
jgi:hypothetical protein